ncbi:MAG TPA: sugar ABC transporter permease [Candidatus Limnocylindrales bacterium]|nr:sugar ABC transporter permease [Candidatus Limnocylindrales bacterium]
MNPIIPVLVVGISALVGAGLLALVFRQAARMMTVAALVGAGAGVAGALLFMLPLNFCTFEAERKTIDFGFGIVLIAIGILAAVLIARWLLRAVFERRPMFAAEHTPGAFKHGWLAYIFLAPTVIILLLFLYYPAIDTFSVSTQLVRLGIPRTAFVCVSNFTSLAGDPAYAQALGVTILISVAVVFFSLSLSLMVALVAYLPLKGARIYRTLLIWPYSISPVVAGVIFLLIFNPLAGIFNHFFSMIFGVSIPWLNSPVFAPWAVIVVSVWKSIGFNILFYIAGLQNVPGDLVEAAAIDGANAWRRFWSIVFPMLSPITFFLLITNMTYAFFETFGTIDTLTGGGPLSSTTTLMYRIYDLGFTNRDLGKAAAQSIVLFVMVIGFTLLQFRTSARNVTYGA